ncbi:MAG: hypothetical protein A2W19_05405 [Spirochaetes bacterium RBG_16_49_21]|nr:MAG: hypothetical protein A2W19_05405 [Spirochaetes bacterium RBG_16_49_21]
MEFVIDKSPSDISRMKWLFIAPGNLMGDFSNIPNGIGILASILEMNSIPVFIKDYSVEDLDYDDLTKIIIDEKITHVGFTYMTCQAIVAYAIAKFIRTIKNDIIIAGGGIHATLLPDEGLNNGIDIIYRDEAEVSFVESLPFIVKKIFDYRQLSRIRGISYFHDGKMVSTTDAERITDLDAVPLPAYHFFKFPEKYTTQFVYKKGYSTNLITSRGCTGHCFFCSKHYNGVHFQSAEKVVEQFIFLRNKYHISQIFVQDDFFTYDIDRVMKICDLLIEKKVNVPWICSNTRADSVSYELFKKMKESGCISVAFGVESGDEKVRARIGKKLKTEDIFNAVALARKAGLLTSAFYIFGHHVETWDDALETIRFSIQLNTDNVSFSTICPFPGTPLYRMLKQKRVSLPEDWGKYRTWGEPLFDTEHLTRQQIVKLRKIAYRRYYLRASCIFRQIKNMFTSGTFYMYWNGFRWLLEQYFDYKILAKNKPRHLKNENKGTAD